VSTESDNHMTFETCCSTDKL